MPGIFDELDVQDYLLEGFQAESSEQDKLERCEKADDKLGTAQAALALASIAACKVGGIELDQPLLWAEQALEGFQAQYNKEMQARAHLVLARIYFLKTRTEDCHAAATSALSLFKEVGMKSWQARAFHSMALSYTIVSDIESAVVTAGKALQLFQEVGDGESQARELQMMARWYLSISKPHKAYPKAKAAGKLLRDLGSQPKSQARALLLTLEALVGNGHPKRATALAEEEVKGARAAGNEMGVAFFQAALALTYIMVGSAGQAAEVAGDLLRASKKAGDKRVAINLLHAVYEARKANGEHDLAVKAMQEAASLARGLSDQFEEADALKAMATAYDEADGPDAISAIADAKSLYQAAGCTGAEAQAALVKSLLLVAQGDVSGAVEEASEAAEMYRSIEDMLGEAAAHRAAANLYLAMRNTGSALEPLQAAADLYEQLGRKEAQATLMCDMAEIYLFQEEPEEAAQIATEAKDLGRDVGVKIVEARAWLVLAQVYLGDLAQEEPKTPEFGELRRKAVAATRDALAAAGKSGDKGIRAVALLWRAEGLLWLSHAHDAMLTVNEAEAELTKLGLPLSQVHAMTLRAELECALGDRDKAKDTAAAALELVRASGGASGAEAAVQAVLERIERAGRAPVPVAAVAAEDAGTTAVAAASVAPAAKGMDPAMAQKKVMDLVKSVLTEDEGVEPDTPFMEAGIDSLGSVQLVTDVGREFSIPLAPSVVFDFPTTRALAEHLCEEIKNG